MVAKENTPYFHVVRAPAWYPGRLTSIILVLVLLFALAQGSSLCTCDFKQLVKNKVGIIGALRGQNTALHQDYRSCTDC